MKPMKVRFQVVFRMSDGSLLNWKCFETIEEFNLFRDRALGSGAACLFGIEAIHYHTTHEVE